MLDDEINKKISEAADQYHPAYDDKAWEMMVRMLDEHLPQKKDRRKLFYFLVLTGIVCIGLFFIFYFTDKRGPVLFSTGTMPRIGDASVHDKKTGSLAITPSNNSDNFKRNAGISPRKNGKLERQKPAASVATRDYLNEYIAPKHERVPTGAKARNNGKTDVTIQNATADISTSDRQSKSSAVPEKLNGNPAGNTSSASQVNTVKNETAGLANTDTPSRKEHPASPGAKPLKSPAKNIKIDRRFSGNFSITVSAGPDVSGVNISKTGRMTIAYGAGLNYDISHRLALRTGFYVARKIYSVGEDDYHFPTGNVGNNAYLENINANCKVYEIPVVVSYNFSKAKNHGWFVATGLSTYLMNKESYVYDYKYPSGTVDEKYWSISNKNKSYFSVWNLSAGYQYKLNKRISLTAEPYVKIPFSGIGAGKIKLNSGGVLFNVTVKPFNK